MRASPYRSHSTHFRCNKSGVRAPGDSGVGSCLDLINASNRAACVGLRTSGVWRTRVGRGHVSHLDLRGDISTYIQLNVIESLNACHGANLVFRPASTKSSKFTPRSRTKHTIGGATLCGGLGGHHPAFKRGAIEKRASKMLAPEMRLNFRENQTSRALSRAFEPKMYGSHS